MPRRYIDFGPSHARAGFLRLIDQVGQLVPLRRFYVFVYNNNFLSLAASLSWRCLAASTAYFLHVPKPLRPPSVAVSTHISTSNTVTLQPRYAKRLDVALYAISPLFLLPAPFALHCTLKVSEHDLLWQPPAAHSDESSPPSTKVFSCAMFSQYSPTELSRGHGCPRSPDGLVSCAVPR